MFSKGFVKMQGNYNELVQSNKDFIGILDNLNQAQRKEEDMRRASEISKRIIITRQISRLLTTSSIPVRWSLVIYNKKIYFTLDLFNKNR